MADVTPPFDTDRFARDLPELLAGKEPIIDTVAARRWLTTSEGRAAVRDVADAVAVMRGMPRSVVGVEVNARRHRRAMEHAVRHGRNRLARIIRAVFVADIEELARESDGPLVRTSFERSELPHARTELARVGERAVKFLGQASFPDAQSLRSARMVFTQSASRRGIHAMLAVLERIDPCSENEYSRLLIGVRFEKTQPIDELATLGRRGDSIDLIARCAILRGVLSWEAGDSREALNCDRFGVEFAARPTAPLYNAVLHAALIGDATQSARYADRLSEVLASDRVQVRVLRELVLADAGDWRVADQRDPTVLRRLFEALRR